MVCSEFWLRDGTEFVRTLGMLVGIGRIWGSGAGSGSVERSKNE
jgi:hypothetical protein